MPPETKTDCETKKHVISLQEITHLLLLQVFTAFLTWLRYLLFVTDTRNHIASNLTECMETQQPVSINPTE
jgi:hypothetical protein